MDGIPTSLGFKHVQLPPRLSMLRSPPGNAGSAHRPAHHPPMNTRRLACEGTEGTGEHGPTRRRPAGGMLIPSQRQPPQPNVPYIPGWSNSSGKVWRPRPQGWAPSSTGWEPHPSSSHEVCAYGSGTVPVAQTRLPVETNLSQARGLGRRRHSHGRNLAPGREKASFNAQRVSGGAN